MGQVGTGWTGTGSIVGIEPVPGLGQEGLHIGWDMMRLGQGGLQIRWDRMGLGQVSFDLSLSQWDRFGTGSVPVPCACTRLFV